MIKSLSRYQKLRRQGVCTDCSQKLKRGTLCGRCLLRRRKRVRRQGGYRSWSPGGPGRPPLGSRGRKIAKGLRNILAELDKVTRTGAPTNELGPADRRTLMGLLGKLTEAITRIENKPEHL